MFQCNMCPRKCGVDRDSSRGVCGVGARYRVARAALHHWEEPCISGPGGSGTVFFSGCPLKCVYCQNYEISRKCFGKEITEERLTEIFDELAAEGAHNINLVSPTQYALPLASTLKMHKPRIPVVYNTGGYEEVGTLRQLDGLIDIYLTDLKYYDSAVSEKYSRAADYFEKASAAVAEMSRQAPSCEYDENGILKKGLIIRHLVLPGNVSQCIKVLDWTADNLPSDTIISVMSQYTPCGEAENYPTINRRLSRREYDIAVKHARSLGFANVYIQQLDSSKEEYIPPFDLSGI